MLHVYIVNLLSSFLSRGCLSGSLECFHRISLLLLPLDLRVPLNVLLGGALVTINKAS